MNWLVSIFINVYVKEFYRQNIVFFVISVALLFGFMRVAEHMALASFFVSSYSTTLFPFAAWVFYVLKVMDFIGQAIRKKENEFTYHFKLFTRSMQLRILSAVWFLLLAPIIAYALFLVAIATTLQQEMIIPLFVFYILLLTVMGIFLMSRLLNNPDPEKISGSLKQWIDRKFHKPYGILLTEWTVRRDLTTFLLLKIVISLLLSGVIFLYTTESYDDRLLNMGAVIGFSGTAPFMFNIQFFEGMIVPWIKNMPFTLTKRITYRLLCIFLLFLPETGILIGNFPPGLPLTDRIPMLLLCYSLPVLFNGILFIRSMGIERYNYLVFYIAIAEVVLVLFNVPILILFSINVALGIFLYRRYYYRYE